MLLQPGFFPLHFAQALEDFKALIVEELADAQKIAASGVPAKEVYGRVIKSGRTKV